MKVATIYASNSGSTEIVAKTIAEVLEKKHKVEILKAKDCSAETVDNFDLVLLGSPSWFVNDLEGQPLEYILEFMDKIKDKVAGKKMAFFGCGDRGYVRFCQAVDIMAEKMLDAGAIEAEERLKINHFFFDMEKNLEVVKIWAEKLSEGL